MVTTELGACEWFVWDLRRSNLIDRGQLDQIVSEFLQTNPRAEPPALADYLVAQGIISQFQAERLLQGKTQGFVLGPFTLMDAIGMGSMGTVYKAVSKNDGSWYAVKVLPRRSMWNVRIARRKVRAFETCQHPAVVPFVDVGTAGGMHYLAWPFIEGEPLDKYVERVGPLSSEQTADLAFQMAEGLEVCHQQGLFHGLFKPSNVMIGQDGEIAILDFGIGCLLAEMDDEGNLMDTMSTSNSVVSGLYCASPESIMEPTNLNALGDQYSLGCVIYFCLAGQYPFSDGTAAELMMSHQFKEPAALSEMNPNVPPELLEIVERLMQKAPEARYGSSAEVVEALRPFTGHAPAPKAVPMREPAGGQLPLSSPGRETPPFGGTPREQIGAVPAVRNSNRPSSATTPAPKLPARPSVTTQSQVSKPDLLSQLPTRQNPASGRNSGQETMKIPRGGQTAAVPRVPNSDPNIVPGQERHIPGDLEAGRRSWEERLGPIGIAVGAVIAAILAWVVASRLF
ncbi:MAG: serine/threonine protein kinase [Gemmataceae bacterium]